MAGKAKKSWKPVILVWGAEEYEVAKRAKEIVEELCPPDQQAFGLETVDGRTTKDGNKINSEMVVNAINQTLTAIRTVGFFGEGKTIWLRDALFLAPPRGGSGDDGGEEGATEPAAGATPDDERDVMSAKDRIAELAAEIKKGLPEGQKLVISAVKVHRASVLFKAIQAAGEIIEFNPPEKPKESAKASVEYVRDAFAEAGLNIRGDLVEEFFDRTGGDTRQIRSEIEKLFLYMGGRKDVRIEDIRAIVSSTREAVAWDLTGALFKRDLPKTLATLRHLLFQKESPQGLIAMIENRLRDLIVIRQAMDQRWLRFEKEGGWKTVPVWTPDANTDRLLSAMPNDPREKNPYATVMLAEDARKFSFEELLRAHRLTTEAHEKMVSGGAPAEIVLEHLLISVMRGENRARA